MRAKEFIKENNSLSRARLVKKAMKPVTDKEKLAKMAADQKKEVDEQTPAANAKALVGSGRGPTGDNPKGKSDSHRGVRTPGTTYSELPNRKKYGKVGARDGMIGG